ncbi:MAG: class I SAM-dependent methyltransferase [Victivallales bacterium]|nr:class I SAM-dependent methyltransferase [Victivallales bacterium]
MSDKFTAPCSRYYGCQGNDLRLYSRDDGKVDFVECASCGLIWRDLTSCADERTFDEVYFQNKGYDKKWEHKVLKSHLLLNILEKFCVPGKILDVGPGLGYNMFAARQRGWQVEGLDVSDFVIKSLESKDLIVHKGDIFDLKHGDYDVVFMKHVLEHYQDPFAALNHVGSLLKQNGLILVMVPNSEHRKAQKLRNKYKFYSHKENGIEHYVYFNKKTLRDILEFSGFAILQEDYPFFDKGKNSLGCLLSRLFRRWSSRLRLNQELLVIAGQRQGSGQANMQHFEPK